MSQHDLESCKGHGPLITNVCITHHGTFSML